MGSKYPWKKTFRALAKKAKNNDDWEIKMAKGFEKIERMKIRGNTNQKIRISLKRWLSDLSFLELKILKKLKALKNIMK